jgi:hypothetical protein
VAALGDTNFSLNLDSRPQLYDAEQLDLGNGVKKEKKEMGLLIKKINNKKKEKEGIIEN